MAGGNQVVVVPHLLVEGAKLDEPVAHHVGVGRIARLDFLHGVSRHLVPVFAVAVYHLQAASEPSGHSRGHLQVFLRGAVPFLLFLWPYLDVEAVGLEPHAGQLVYHHRTVDAAREQHGYPLVLYLVYVNHIAKVVQAEDNTKEKRMFFQFVLLRRRLPSW